jgi:septal ring factor EnvC (AmiA/AmiB activator)
VAVATPNELARAKRPDLRASPPRLRLPEKRQTPEPSVLQRLVLLEALIRAQAVQISDLSSENQAQRKRIDEHETDLAALRLEIGRVDRQADRLDLELSEQQEDIRRLEGNVQYCLDREDEIVEAVIDTVTEQISQRGLSAANIHFTLGEG